MLLIEARPLPAGRTHPHSGAPCRQLELNQHPDVVDELEGQVEQFLRHASHVHRATGDGEHVIQLQLLLNLVWGEREGEGESMQVKRDYAYVSILFLGKGIIVK